MLIIRIYVENNSIILQLNTPAFTNMPNTRKPRCTRKSILELLLENFVYPDTDKVTKALNRQELPDIIVRLVYDSESRSDTDYISSLVNYTLPIDPAAVIDLMATLEKFRQVRDYSHIVVIEHDIHKYIMDHLEDVRGCDPRIGNYTRKRMKGYFTDLLANGSTVTESYPISKAIIDCVLKLKSCPPEYERVRDTLSAIRHYSNSHAEHNFSLCMTSMPHRLNALMQIPEPALFNQDKSRADTVKFIYSLQRQFIACSKRDELNHALNNLVHHTKLQLIGSAIGKIALNGDAYSTDSDEIQFMLKANFYIRSDQRVGINVVANPRYQSYALTPAMKDLFAKKLEFLVSILGLEYDKIKTDFNKEIIFTESCSRDLVDKGLHRNLEYLKTLLTVKNNSAVMKLGAYNTTFFSRLQPVAKNIIIPLMYENHNEIVSDEFNTFKEIGWSAECNYKPKITP